MPLNLARLTRNRASATVDFGPAVGALQVEYYPARVTSQLLLDIADADRLTELSAQRAVEVVTSPAQRLLDLLASWDLTETDPDSGVETPAPLDAAHLEALGVQHQWTILYSVLAAQNRAATGEPSASAVSVSAPSSDAISPPTAH